MSLVNYGASDDSDTSDVDEISTNVQTTDNVQKATPGHISDEDDFDASVGSSVTSTTRLGLRSVNVSEYNVPLVNSTKDDSVNSTSVTSLEDLPAPQSQTHSTETEEAELEEVVKPKASEVANAPKPPSKKPKQPVKITIPSLDEEPNDEETESKKRIDPSTVKSGLFSLLPAPVYAAKKETNRPLIPQSLTRKKVPVAVSTTSNTGNKQSSSNRLKRSSDVASTTDFSSKRMTPFNALTGYDSDSDDDDDDNKGSTTNFFSLTSSSEVKKTTDKTSVVTARRLQSEEVSSSKSESNSGVTNQSLHVQIVEDIENVNEEEDSVEDKDTGPEPGAVNDAPLDFRSMNRLSAWSASSYGFLEPVGLTGPVPQPKSYVSSSSLPSSSEYNLVSSEVTSDGDDDGAESVADEDLKKFMSDKEFQKLQGKRKRGLEEAINFVDANVDDYVDPSEVTKYFTEETDYVSHKSKDNLPTAQQRRKKQITYLAYQAKERELELKNTWAQNRMTKKQTQSKYGF